VNTKYLTLDDIIAIHESMIEEYGGSHGIRDIGLLQSANARSQASFGGEDLYHSIFDKATALFHSLLFNHVFVDGNKRTCITATARFLFINGYELITTDKELVSFPLKVENEHWDLEKIKKWLNTHTKKLSSF